VGFVVLITWFAAVLMGLFMLAVWLIENDVTGRDVARSRLPVPVVFAHMQLPRRRSRLARAFRRLHPALGAAHRLGVAAPR